MKTFFIALSLFLLLLKTSTATTGFDNLVITLQEGSSIQEAIDNIPRAGVIKLESGKYIENIVIGDKKIRLESANPEGPAVLQPKNILNPLIEIMSVEKTSSLIMNGLVLTGRTGIESGSNNIVIRNCRFNFTQLSIRCSARAALTIEGSSFTGDNFNIAPTIIITDIDNSTARNITISDNYFTGFAGIVMYETANFTSSENNDGKLLKDIKNKNSFDIYDFFRIDKDYRDVIFIPSTYITWSHSRLSFCHPDSQDGPVWNRNEDTITFDFPAKNISIKIVSGQKIFDRKDFLEDIPSQDCKFGTVDEIPIKMGGGRGANWYSSKSDHQDFIYLFTCGVEGTVIMEYDGAFPLTLLKILISMRIN